MYWHNFIPKDLYLHGGREKREVWLFNNLPQKLIFVSFYATVEKPKLVNLIVCIIFSPASVFALSVIFKLSFHLQFEADFPFSICNNGRRAQSYKCTGTNIFFVTRIFTHDLVKKRSKKNYFSFQFCYYLCLNQEKWALRFGSISFGKILRNW